MAVRVREYRGGEMVGSVVRDIQVRVIPCTNTNPYISGINGTNSFSASACAGSNLSFQIFSYDNDPGQNLSLTWNNAISGASFTTTNAQHPTGTFSWTPTAADVSTLPYCFTVTVTDDNCPLNGTQTYSFCITVTGFNVNATSTPASCGLTNGTTSVSVSGGNAPYTYAWSSGQTTANVNGISAGVYTVNVSDAAGCMMTDSVTVQQGAAPANVQMSTTAVSCFGGNNGSANANVYLPVVERNKWNKHFKCNIRKLYPHRYYSQWMCHTRNRKRCTTISSINGKHCHQQCNMQRRKQRLCNSHSKRRNCAL
jgi:hypothetical protein